MGRSTAAAGQAPGRRRSRSWRMHLVDHALQPELAAVVRREDAGDAVGVQFARSRSGRMVPPPPAKMLRYGRPRLPSRRSYMYFEVLDVAALVARDRNPLGVLLDGAVDDLLRPLRLWPRWMTSAPLALQDAPHDVDGRIVAVEERGRRDDADVMFRAVGLLRVRRAHEPGITHAGRAGRRKLLRAATQSGHPARGPSPKTTLHHLARKTLGSTRRGPRAPAGSTRLLDQAIQTIDPS